MYRDADNVTVPALIDDPSDGEENPGVWANSAAYDSEPTSIYLIGTDTTFQYLVNFALFGWQMSYDELDAKIQELLDQTAIENPINETKNTNSYYQITNDNKVIIGQANAVSLKVYNFQGKEILKIKDLNCKVYNLENKLSKGSYIFNLELMSGRIFSRTIVIR